MPPPSHPGLAAQLTFGAQGNATLLLRTGWSVPEPGFTWTVDDESRLSVPYPAGEGVLHLEMRVFAMAVPPALPHQRLGVRVNGVNYGTQTIAQDTWFGVALTGVAAGSAGELDIVLTHPDAAAPADLAGTSDTRRLAVAVRTLRLFWLPAAAPIRPRTRPPLRITGPDVMAEMVRGCTGLMPADLAFCLESLGANCELGLVQRRLQAEPLGLLRFTGISPAALLEGLESGFDGVEDPGQITLLEENNAGRQEYLIRCERYDFQFHSFVAVDTVTPNAMKRKMVSTLDFLRRKFVETLRLGNKLFVFHHPACATPAQALPYLRALRAWGPNALLFVTAGTAEAGSVSHVDDGLFQGHIDRLGIGEGGQDINGLGWLSICANGYRMWRESGAGG